MKTKENSGYNYPKNTKFCLCAKVKTKKSDSRIWELLDLTPYQAEYFLAHFDKDYYYINEVANYVLINVFLKEIIKILES